MPPRDNGPASEPGPQRPNWGGRRPGAGAPKGNLNALKQGRYSRQLQTLMDALVRDPMLRDALLAQRAAERRKQRNARIAAAGILAILIDGKPAPRRTLVRLGNNQEFFVRFLSRLIAKAREFSENIQDPNTIPENDQVSPPDGPGSPAGRAPPKPSPWRTGHRDPQ